MKYKDASKGFTLVEAMIALLIGLLVVLGAGKIYLTSFKSFKDIGDLSDRQAALTYAADTLVQDIRRADLTQTCPFDEEAEIALKVEGECRYYGLMPYPERGEVSLRLKVNSKAWQPVVSGFKDMGSFAVRQADPVNFDGLFRVSFDLVGESEIVFYVFNRTASF